jgi:hypothetical protein
MKKEEDKRPDWILRDKQFKADTEISVGGVLGMIILDIVSILQWVTKRLLDLSSVVLRFKERGKGPF